MSLSYNTVKEEWIAKYLAGSVRQALIDQQFIQKGELYSVAEVLQITKEELKDYLDQHGYPKWDIPKSAIMRIPIGGECSLVWTFDEESGIYEAHFIERGMSTTQYSSTDKHAFESWWKNEELEELYFSMSYKWKA